MTLSAPASAFSTNAPYFTAIDATNGQSSIALSLGASPVVGTHSCPTDGVDIEYQGANGVPFYAGVNWAPLVGPGPNSCTITVTSYTAAGMPFQGTFSGTVVEANTAGGTLSHVITNGQFNLIAP